jgi:hypothetical protein
MDEIRLPQHVVRRIERRWAARLWQMANNARHVYQNRPQTYVTTRRGPCTFDAC